MYKKVKILFGLAVLFFVTAAVLSVGYFINRRTSVIEKAASQTTLTISPSDQDLARGENFRFGVLMDTGGNQVTGIDLTLKFDPSQLQISNITRGSGVEALSNTIVKNFDNTAGDISYTIFTLDKSTAVHGSNLEILTVDGVVNNNASIAKTLITFDPTTAIAASNEGGNALAGGVNGSINIVSATPVPTPTVTATPTPTQVPGAPNSCGGTCGSNSNCASNLVCYQGYCRNPSCSWSTDCSCNVAATATPRPTTAATIKPKTAAPTAKATATVKASATPTSVAATPAPTADNYWQTVYSQITPTPFVITTPLPVEEISSGISTISFLPWIIGSLIVAGITLLLIVFTILGAGRPRNRAPVIKV